MRVFVVDDSLLVSARIVESLSKIDRVEFAGVAYEHLNALEKLNEFKPDVVILGSNLVIGSGIYAIKKIKDGWPETIVVIFADSTNPQYRERCMKLGSD